MNVKILGATIAGLMFITAAHAQMAVNNFETQTINFNSYDGVGFADDGTAGTLDSTKWGFNGLSGVANGNNTTYSGSYLAADDTRYGGTTEGAGFFSGQHSSLNGGEGALGMLPTSTQLQPGNVTLRIQNQTGITWQAFDIAYEAWGRNATANSTFLDFSWSDDGESTFNSVSAFDYSTPGGSPFSNDWEKQDIATTTITGVNVASGDFLFLRWMTGDENYTGSGSRDPVALDNIQFTAVPEPHEYALIAGLGLIAFALYRRRFARAA